MKLYDSVGPNPHVVRMFIAEKGIEMPRQPVDLRKGENREADHLKRNPHGQMPTLELDNGQYLSEITAICEYLEETNPTPALIGVTPEARAECRMWTRRVDLNICEHLGNGYRFGEGGQIFPEAAFPVAPEASPGLKAGRSQPPAMAGRTDSATARNIICGDRFTLADMLLYCWIDFFGREGRPTARRRPTPTSHRMDRAGRRNGRRRRRRSRLPLSFRGA